MLKRVAAIILNDKKVLMVTGHGADFYWTPGGMIDKSESSKQALSRELKEELRVMPKNIKEYFTYQGYKLETGKPMEVVCFLADYEGSLIPDHEVSSYMWYSRSHFDKKSPRLFYMIEEILIPKLIEDDLL